MSYLNLGLKRDRIEPLDAIEEERRNECSFGQQVAVQMPPLDLHTVEPVFELSEHPLDDRAVSIQLSVECAPQRTAGSFRFGERRQDKIEAPVTLSDHTRSRQLNPWVQFKRDGAQPGRRSKQRLEHVEGESLRTREASRSREVRHGIPYLL